MSNHRDHLDGRLTNCKRFQSIGHSLVSFIGNKISDMNQNQHWWSPSCWTLGQWALSPSRPWCWAKQSPDDEDVDVCVTNFQCLIWDGYWQEEKVTNLGKQQWKTTTVTCSILVDILLTLALWLTQAHFGQLVDCRKYFWFVWEQWHQQLIISI